MFSSSLRPARQNQPGGKIWCQDLVTGAGDLEHSVSGEMSPWLGRSSAADLLQTEPDSQGPNVSRSLRLPSSSPWVSAEQPLKSGRSPQAASALAMHLSSLHCVALGE